MYPVVSREARRLATESAAVDPLAPTLGKLDAMKYSTLAASWHLSELREEKI